MLARILAAPAANLQVQVNAAVRNVETRIATTVTAAVAADITETVQERVVQLDAGRQAHLHVQEEASTAWYVRHGLPFDPAALDVLADDGGGPDRWWPEVIRPEPGVLVILFPTPTTGTARLS